MVNFAFKKIQCGHSSRACARVPATLNRIKITGLVRIVSISYVAECLRSKMNLESLHSNDRILIVKEKIRSAINSISFFSSLTVISATDPVINNEMYTVT